MKHKIIFQKLLYKCLIIFAMVFMMSGIIACSNEGPQGILARMSFISSQGTHIIEKEVYLQGTGIEEQLAEVLEYLSAIPSKLEYQVPLSQGIEVLSVDIKNGILFLNVSEEYKSLETVTEILTRASLVKSLTQIEGISAVNIQIAGEPLRDNLDKAVGALRADMFIDNAGEEISTYEKITVRLYFANEEGDGLVAVNRSKAYNTNISLDKFVMEELLKGPEATTQGVYPTINPETKLISTLVKDKTCYVNLDSTFLKQIYEVDAEIVIYSIVNSLCELSGIDRVQISVDGSYDIMFWEVIPLMTMFSRDLNYIKK